jgi:hypothetical protein
LPRIEARKDLAGFDEPRRFAQDVAVMRAAFGGQQRQQREDAGIGRRPE